MIPVVIFFSTDSAGLDYRSASCLLSVCRYYTVLLKSPVESRRNNDFGTTTTNGSSFLKDKRYPSGKEDFCNVERQLVIETVQPQSRQYNSIRNVCYDESDDANYNVDVLCDDVGEIFRRHRG